MALDDLYKRLLPAINTKVDELKRIKFNVTNIDIWDYCINLWSNRKELRMYELVDDILNIDELKLNDFLKERRNKK